MKLLNIETFFLKSNCCNTTNEAGEPCQTQPRTIDPQLYFKHYFKKNVTIHAPTITIGNIKYGQLSAKDQYTSIVKAIKECYPFHGNTKYMFYPEFTKSGVIHLHGALIDAYQARFIDHFNQFGQRNTHKDSYQVVQDLEYFKYIKKDQLKMLKYWKNYKMIHNIKKQDMKSLSDKV